jgi:hypothetical protein
MSPKALLECIESMNREERNRLAALLISIIQNAPKTDGPTMPRRFRGSTTHPAKSMEGKSNPQSGYASS